VTATTWLALGGALGLVGGPAGGSVRARGLAAGGRLVALTGSPSVSGWLGGLRWRPVALVAVLTAVSGVAVTAGPSLALALGALAATAATLACDVVRSRAAGAHHRQLLACVGVLVGELEAGAQPPVALGSAAQAGPSGAVTAAFARAAEVARRGGDAGAALQDAGDPAVLRVGLAWQLGSGSGAALADVLDRVRSDLTAADEQRRTVAVALAGPRSSAALLSGLPLLGIGLGVAMGARPLPFLLETPAGRLLCCVGVLLDVAGVLWMRRILRRAADP
jgi:tight adherence protein B